MKSFLTFSADVTGVHHLMTELLDAAGSHSVFFLVLSAVSLAVFGVSVLVVPWIIGRLPETFFIDFCQADPRAEPGEPRYLLRLLKNGAGAAFMAAGVIMLVTPGQGLLTLLLGITMVDFPGKRRLVRRILGFAGVRTALNWIRNRRGAREFVFPDPGAKGNR